MVLSFVGLYFATQPAGFKAKGDWEDPKVLKYDWGDRNKPERTLCHGILRFQ